MACSRVKFTFILHAYYYYYYYYLLHVGRAATFIYLKQTMFLEDIVLQLLCTYNLWYM